MDTLTIRSSTIRKSVNSLHIAIIQRRFALIIQTKKSTLICWSGDPAILMYFKSLNMNLTSK